MQALYIRIVSPSLTCVSACICVNLRVCTCVRECMCLRCCSHGHVCVGTYVSVCVHVCVCGRACMRACVCVWVRGCVFVCARDRAHVCACEKNVCHRCQPSRNRAGNPAFWLISRIPVFFRKHPAFLALFRNIKKSMKIAIILAIQRHFVQKRCAKTSISSVLVINVIFDSKIA